MNKDLRIKIGKWVLFCASVMLLGGIGAIVLERGVLPYLSTSKFFGKFKFLDTGAPIVITRREEIRLSEQINNLEVIGKVKNALVRAQLSDGSAVSGMIITNDGMAILPSDAFKGRQTVSITLSSGISYTARIVATDNLTAVTFAKIDTSDLSVSSQGFSQERQVAETLLVVWTTELPGSVSAIPVVLTTRSLVQPSPSKIYDLVNLNATVPIYPGPGFDKLGAVVADKNGSIVGFVTAIGKDAVVIRSEDLKLAINNFLDDQKIAWPGVKLTYTVLTENQAAAQNLPQKFGVMVKGAAAPVQPGDFIYNVAGQDLRLEEGFQQILLSKKAGEKVKLKLIRDEQELEVEIIL